MLEINETHEKVIEILKEKGPSLPIQIAKEMNMNSLFVSAFLSELLKEKKIKVSYLKVGGSPLYFLDGQEEQLEKFQKHLHPKEIEAFLLIKKNKILKDSEQEPAIRVALRSIKDFVEGFKKNDEIYWRYLLASEEEIREMLVPEQKSVQKARSDIQYKVTKKEKIGDEFQNPLIIKKSKKTKKQKERSEFILNTTNFIIKNNLKISKEINYKVKEYNCLIQVNSDLGSINFLTQAKDKKTISETDLKKLLSNAQLIPLPAFFLYTGKLSKKAKEYVKKYSSILKTKKII